MKIMFSLVKGARFFKLEIITVKILITYRIFSSLELMKFAYRTNEIYKSCVLFNDGQAVVKSETYPCLYKKSLYFEIKFRVDYIDVQLEYAVCGGTSSPHLQTE